LRSFFSCAIPAPTRILLVESGSRSIQEKAIEVIRRVYPECQQIDVLTCYAGAPQGANGRIYRVADYATQEARDKFFAELKTTGYAAMGILCTAEPIMTKWKFAVAARLRAKLMVINENADFFWCDRGNWKILSTFMLFRAGLTGASAVPTLARLLFLPLTAAYLLAYAAAVHFRRMLRS
jgi:hypothetical protein